MDPKPQPRASDYLKYLEGKIDENPPEISFKVQPIRAPAEQTPTLPPRSRAIFIVGGIIVVVLLGLVVRGFIFPKPLFLGTASEFARLQEESRKWAWSSARGMVLERLKRATVSEIAWDKVETKFLGIDQWHISGVVDSADARGINKQSKWEIDITYLPEKKTGELLKVLFDGTMIYSK